MIFREKQENVSCSQHHSFATIRQVTSYDIDDVIIKLINYQVNRSEGSKNRGTNQSTHFVSVRDVHKSSSRIARSVVEAIILLLIDYVY